ncbi:VOC family protein [Phytohabitans suffuscus]|uniref:VOC domain-containing protein n=1 Tax=Phytohabitans suffuscus TaxID=624315 RepID=A0A6F8YUN0_9ACTN|nr:VOC family protein [Phytohabitans suffuscus]BCB89860.1 hypothetical protein Psuf_071730 [Phytohabitans suffuscus]
MRAASHIAIGVTDLERSLVFYRDLLGLTVIRDAVNEPPSDTGLYHPVPATTRRREVFLRFGDPGDVDSVFIALSQPDVPDGSRPIGLGQVGIHHVGFWADGVAERAERLRAAGVEVVSVTDTTGVGYGEDAGTRMRAMFVKDPDGTILQFDERLG